MEPIVYEVDPTGKYILQVPRTTTMYEAERLARRVHAFFADPGEHVLVISDDVKLVKIDSEPDLEIEDGEK